MSNRIIIKSVRELLGMKFYIPNYQRGYRWDSQQIEDLLEDLFSFANSLHDTNNSNAFYCLQPVAVKEDIPQKQEFINQINLIGNEDPLNDCRLTIQEFTRWEVIDGQQRLTAILLLLNYLGSKHTYEIEYSTRKDLKDFLQNINKGGFTNNADENKNIDRFHICQSINRIKEWFDRRTVSKADFLDILLDKVKFIWYELADENPIEVFKRLNVGRIGLTNAELIKALLLNRSNFNNNHTGVQLQQQEIAIQWDSIEYQMQNEEFWLFFNNTNYSNPTRIDFIFNFILDVDALKLYDNPDTKVKACGSDKYKTFRYVYNYIEKSDKDRTKQVKSFWEKVLEIFHILNEWFNDLELYHYLGFLINYGDSVNDWLNQWLIENDDKTDFKESVYQAIKDKIKPVADLNTQYKIDDEDHNLDKKKCQKVLLLHNIETIIRQNQNYKSEYELGIFYKFPFHLFKLEKWDVEHIDSSTTNDETCFDTQKEILLNYFLGVDNETQEKIKKYITGKCEDPSAYEDLKESLKPYGAPEDEALSIEDKNKIWNYTLLDSSTNRSYGNSVFAAKRRIIKGKDLCQLIPIPKLSKGKKSIDCGSTTDAKSSFVPPVTRNIFMKYYSPVISSTNYWGLSDAKAYRANIYELLKKFGVTIIK